MNRQRAFLPVCILLVIGCGESETTSIVEPAADVPKLTTLQEQAPIAAEPDPELESKVRAQQKELEAVRKMQEEVQRELDALRDQLDDSNQQLQRKQQAVEQLDQTLSAAPIE